ncbi:M23 family metallopeptidase [Algirhabdus cladophorae]|uniref:M23 family metallopeptidase n=1 Tax=Algirhabdus cladophorae TaxID=3377108 RepID=UPI003B84880E
MGDDCYIQHFVDSDPSPERRDFRCGLTTYEGHKGTDFALPSLRAMELGVNVIAAAPGTVIGLRDGVPDQIYSAENADQVEGIECGNGVVIRHGDGWTTQYCHLEQDSVSVIKGQRVAMGAVLGRVGLSGKTQFPHVHLTLRKDNEVVDPFAPAAESCGAPETEKTLWLEAPDYEPGGVITAGFATKVPEYADIKAGTAAERDIDVTAPALVLWGFGHMAQEGDVFSLRLMGPDGEITQNSQPLTRNRALFFRAAGKKRTQDEWPAGTYTGIVELFRGGQMIDTRQVVQRIE